MFFKIMVGRLQLMGHIALFAGDTAIPSRLFLSTSPNPIIIPPVGLPLAGNLIEIVDVESPSLLAFLNGTGSSLADAQKEPDRAWKSDGLLLYGVIRFYLRSLFFCHYLVSLLSWIH